MWAKTESQGYSLQHCLQWKEKTLSMRSSPEHLQPLNEPLLSVEAQSGLLYVLL